jgi:Arylsulfotransferase (ASST)
MRLQSVGLTEFDRARAYRGYTLIAPLRRSSVYLVDMQGAIVHEWRLRGPMAILAYLLPGGRLLTSHVTKEGPAIFEGKGGHLCEYNWDGNLLWEHTDHGQHHDLRRLPNGNTLFLAWEEMPADRARRVQGGVAGTENAKGGKIYSDFLREVTPDGKVAWEWHAHDLEIERYPISNDCWRWEFAHANSCCPLPDGRVLVSFRHLDTIMMIDRTGKVVWEKRDPLWGHQHNAEVLPNGNILLYANGMINIVQPLHSRVIELDPTTGETVWQYKAPQSWTFFSPVISGAQRLPNGNTLICEGINGRAFEVTREGDTVWEYVSPFFNTLFAGDGPSNALFRVYRYSADSVEIGGRLGR